MEIQVKKLNALKQYTGSFDFDYTPQKELWLLPLSGIDGPVKVSGDFEIYEDDCVGVRFSIVYKIKGQCSYCLNDAENTVSFDSDILYVPEKDDDNYYYDGIKIDLKTAVDDAILISQPGVLLCKPDCKGIDVPK